MIATRALLATAALCGAMSGERPALAFDCAKASLPVDFVICADQQLADAIDDMGQVWRRIKAAAPADQFAPLLANQREWVKTYGPSCGLPAKGRPTAQRIAEATPCVSARIGERLAYLKGVEAGAAARNTERSEWTQAYAQGTIVAGVRNGGGGRFIVECPSGQPGMLPSITFRAPWPLESGGSETVAFTLVIGDGKTHLELPPEVDGDGKWGFTWAAFNDREHADMEAVVERIRAASRFAVELPRSKRREEFSTRNAADALKGVLNGCDAVDDATAAPAPPPAQAAAPPVAPPAAFGAAQLGVIIETAQTNAARFARDFKGKSFRARLTFNSLEDGFFGQKLLTASAGNLSVTCVGRSDLAKAAIDWRVGDAITVSGTIDDTVLGALMLEPCTATK